jgi:hypothetical protein
MEKLTEFIEANKFEVTPTNLLGRCVDGRWDAVDQSKPYPAIAKPGADAGDLMIGFAALNKLGITELELPKIVLPSVMSVVGGPERFFFHTDNHADQGVPGLGCGHLRLARENPETYGLHQSQMDLIFKTLEELLELGAKQEVLDGDHSEQAVVVVESSRYGLKPMMQSDGHLFQAFVYQSIMDQERLTRLVQALYQKINPMYGVSLDAVRTTIAETAQQQLHQTVNALAKGLPQYVVTFDPIGKPEYSFGGII